MIHRISDITKPAKSTDGSSLSRPDLAPFVRGKDGSHPATFIEWPSGKTSCVVSLVSLTINWEGVY